MTFDPIVVRLAAALVALAMAAGGPMAAAALNTTGNGILSIAIEDAGSDAGQFTIRTGALHPKPEQSVFYPVGTSYVTLRDVTAGIVYANSGGGTFANIAPYAFATLPLASSVAIPGGFRTTYATGEWTLVQDLTVAGTTLADAHVRQAVIVTNTSAAARVYGVRFLWDWHIADDPITRIRPRGPDGVFTLDFFAVAAPAFRAFEHVDDVPLPTLAAFGSVQGAAALLPPPTPPDRFGYVSWEDFWPAPWDFPVSGGSGDSATVHYWGYATPLTLAPGASATFVQYVAAEAALLTALPLDASDVPALSPHALGALLALVAMSALAFARGRGSRR